MVILLFVLSVVEYLITGNAIDYSEAFFRDISYNFLVAGIEHLTIEVPRILLAILMLYYSYTDKKKKVMQTMRIITTCL